MPTSKNLLRSLRRASGLRAVNFLLAGQERHLKEHHQRPALPFRCGTASKKHKPGAMGPTTKRPVRLATSTPNSAPSPLKLCCNRVAPILSISEAASATLSGDA